MVTLQTRLIGIAVVVGTLSAAPRINQPDSDIKDWGTFVDPDGDCTAKEMDGRLTISIPGKYHDFNPTARFNNVRAPRVWQEVEGNFVVEVKVRSYPMPKPKTSTKVHSYVGAGLVVAQDDKSFIRLFRSANGDTAVLFASAELYKDTKLVGDNGAGLQNSDTYLRIERRGENFVLAASLDGMTWTTIPTPAIQLNNQLKVGVVAVNSTTAVFAPEFERFKLTRK